MHISILNASSARWLTAAGAAAILAASFASSPSAQTYQPGQGTHEVTLNIERVRALDKLDAFSKGDLFARVTINGKSQDTPVARQQDDFRPNWTVQALVPPGRNDITIELFDKDLTKNDPIDINSVPNKRRHDFNVDTRTCRIVGLAGARCGNPIVRAGAEVKRAEVTFSVNVRR